MPTCYTCQQEITFDKNIRSASGKQIPLNPDNSKHSHDDAGNSTWKPNPNFTPQQTEQFNQYNRQEPSQQQRLQVVAQKTSQLGNESQSRGGSYLDTKRIRVMLEEMTKEIQEVKMMLSEILNSRTILDTSRYEGKNDQIYEVMKPFLNTQGVVASELLKDQQQQKRKDPLSINHGKIADLNEVKQQRTKITEEQDFPIVDTLTDDDEDDDAQEDDSNPKGVIDDL